MNRQLSLVMAALALSACQAEEVAVAPVSAPAVAPIAAPATAPVTESAVKPIEPAVVAATQSPVVVAPTPAVAPKPVVVAIPQTVVVPVVISKPVTPPVVAKPDAPTAPVAPKIVTATVSDADAIALAKKRNCFACHMIDKKVVGPAWKDVAAKYRGDAGAQARMEARIGKGGSGAWGGMAMPPQPQVTAEERILLARFILNLK